MLRPFLTAACGLACLSAGTVRAQTNEPALGFSADHGTNLVFITEQLEKPAVFDSFTDRLDFIHHNMHLTLQQHVEKIDTMFLQEGQEKVQTPPSRFRLAPYFEIRDNSGIEFSFEPDVELEVDLPNLEHSWSVFFESSGTDDLPGLTSSENKEGSQIGFRKYMRHFRTDVGAKARWPPVLFARVEWRPQWSYKHTAFYPKQRFFYQTDDGLGSLTTLTVQRWFGRKMNTYWQTVSAAKYATKKTDGIELEQTVKIGHVRKTLEDKWTWRTAPGTRDIGHGHQLRYSVFGHVNSDEGVIDRHRMTYTYRRPLYKRWIYLEIAPGIEAANENDWYASAIFTVGLDMIFWGTVER